MKRASSGKTHPRPTLRQKVAELEAALREMRDTAAAASNPPSPGPRDDATPPYRVLIETVNEGALAMRADGTITYSNTRFAESVRLPLEEVIGSPFQRFLRESERPTFESLLACGDGVRREFALLAGDQHLLAVQISLHPIGEDGTPLFGAIVTDVTQLRRTEEMLHSIIEHMPNVVVTAWDSAGNYTMAGGQGLAALGLTAEQLLGTSILTMRRRPTPETVEMRRRALTGLAGRYSTEYAGLTFDAWLTPIKDSQGAVLGGVQVAVDATERVNAERELRRRVAQQEAIAALSQWALQGSSFAELLGESVKATATTLGADMCAAYELSAEDRHLQIKAGVGGIEDRTDALRPAATDFLLGGGALNAQESTLAADVTALHLEELRRVTGAEVRSGAGAFIPDRDRAFGALAVYYQTKRKFSQQDLNFLRAVANILAQALARERAEAELRFDRQYYRSLIENVSDAIVVIDAPGRLRYISPACQRILGYSAAEVLNTDVFSYVDPNRQQQDRDNLSWALEHPNQIQTFESRVRHKDGTSRDLEVVRQGIIGPTGEAVVVDTFRDITERKRAERQLREKALQEAAVAAFSQRALQGIEPAALAAEAVQTVTKTLGADASAIYELMPDGEHFAVRGVVGVESGLELGAIFSVRYFPNTYRAAVTQEPWVIEDTSLMRPTRPPDATFQARSALHAPVPGTNRAYGVISAYSYHRQRAFSSDDIDFLRTIAAIFAQAVDRDRVYQELRRSEEYFRSLIENVSDYISVVGQDGKLRFASRSRERVLGYRPDEQPLGDFFDNQDPAYAGISLAAFERALADPSQPVRFEMRVGHKDGSWRDVDQVLQGGKMPDGEVVVVGAMRDITEHKQVERELRQRVAQQGAIAALGRRALDGVPLNELMREAVDIIARTLDTTASIYELFPDDRHLMLRASANFTPQTDMELGQPVPMKEFPQTYHTLLKREPIVVEDLDHSIYADSAWVTRHLTKSSMTVPIFGKQRPYGVAGVWAAYRRKFTDDDVNFLRSMANILAQAADRERADEELRRSEEYYRSMIENASDAVAVVGQDGRLRYLSAAANRILGEGAAPGRVGRSILEFYSEADREYIRRGFQANFEQSSSKQHAAVERRLLREDGTGVDVEMVWHRVISPEGDPVLVTIIRDVAERKRVERERQLLASVVESSDDAITSRDLNLRIISWNRGAEHLFGYQASEVLGSRAEFLDRSEHLAALHNLYRTVIEHGHAAQFECQRLRKDGTIVEVSITASPLVDPRGQVVGVTAISRDLSERIMAERARELARSNAELEQFAYTASHDLREPLSVISAYAQLLTQQLAVSSNPQTIEFLGYIKDGAQRGLELIAALLEYARLAPATSGPTTVNCAEVVGEVCQNLRQAIELAQARVTVRPLPTVQGDRVLLTQIFQNLLANALKFRGKEPPAVEIAAQRSEHEWQFWVRDNGIGIEPRYAERIFKMFERLHGRREYSGTGIGLAICKKAIDRLGGRIWVESQLGAGATFYFTVPAD